MSGVAPAAMPGASPVSEAVPTSQAVVPASAAATGPDGSVPSALVPSASDAGAAASDAGAGKEDPMPSMGAIIKAALMAGSPVETKKVALEWMRLCASETSKAIFAVVDACLELAAIPGCVTLEDVLSNSQGFLEQLPQWVRERNFDLTHYALNTVGGKPGKRTAVHWERFWTISIGGQSVGDLLEFKVPDELDRWIVPMSHHGIRQLRHVATVAALAMAQALSHHLRELIKQRDLNRRQLEVVGNKQGQASLLQHEIDLTEQRIQHISSYRAKYLESTIPHRNRDVCEIIRLCSLVEVDKLMKQDPATYLQQKWTARVFLMIHDQSPEVRLKALTSIMSWFDRLKFFSEEVKDHLFQFAERCMSHIVDRSRDVDPRVACKAIQMLKLPVLAERMTDEEVERIVNLVSMASEPEVRQEAALFVNAQVFQDPGIVLPEQTRKRKRAKTTAGKWDGEGEDDVEAGEEDQLHMEREDSVVTLLNSETSISMFIEYLENFLNQSLRIVDRAVNAFWGKAPCLHYWSTMVSLMILGEANSKPGLDPVSTRQRLILLYVMEAAVRRAMEDVRRNMQSVRDKDAAISKMDAACNSIIPELPRLFELCLSENDQVLILSHICKLLVDHAESRKIAALFSNPRPLIRALQQSILSRCFLDVTKHCTDALLKIAGMTGEAKTAFLESARSIHSDTLSMAAAMSKGELAPETSEDFRIALGKFHVINLRAIDMSLGRIECLDIFHQLLNMRVDSMRKWQEHVAAGGGDDQVFYYLPKEVLGVTVIKEQGEGKFSVELSEVATMKEDAVARGLQFRKSKNLEDKADKKIHDGESIEAVDEGDGWIVIKNEAAFRFPNSIPDTGHTIYLVHSITIVMIWHFRFCHWEQISPGSSEVKELDMVMQGTKINEMFKLAPKMFMKLREQLCTLMEVDASPHVRFLAFSSYMTIMQVALGISDGLDCEGQDEEATKKAPGTITPPQVHPAHMKAVWQYLNRLLTETQSFHATSFDEEGSKHQPRDFWPPLSLSGQVTSLHAMYQELAESREKALQTHDFVAEDGEKGQEQQLLRAVTASRMVHESELEELYAGPVAALVLTQLDRSKPKPLREVAKRLISRLREEARICPDFAVRYFEVQKITVEAVYDQVGAEAAQSLSSEFAKLWGPRTMPWMEQPLYDALVSAVHDCASRGEKGPPLLEAFSLWMRSDEHVSDLRKRELKDLATSCFDAFQSAPGLMKFISRCENFGPPQAAAAAAEANVAGDDVSAAEAGGAEAGRSEPTPTPVGKRIRGKRSVEQSSVTPVPEDAHTVGVWIEKTKKPREGAR